MKLIELFKILLKNLKFKMFYILKFILFSLNFFSHFDFYWSVIFIKILISFDKNYFIFKLLELFSW